jgi:hypothetical protein
LIPQEKFRLLEVRFAIWDEKFTKEKEVNLLDGSVSTWTPVADFDAGFSGGATEVNM